MAVFLMVAGATAVVTTAVYGVFRYFSETNKQEEEQQRDKTYSSVARILDRDTREEDTTATQGEDTTSSSSSQGRVQSQTLFSELFDQLPIEDDWVLLTVPTEKPAAISSSTLHQNAEDQTTLTENTFPTTENKPVYQTGSSPSSLEDLRQTTDDQITPTTTKETEIPISVRSKTPPPIATKPDRSSEKKPPKVAAKPPTAVKPSPLAGTHPPLLGTSPPPKYGVPVLPVAFGKPRLSPVPSRVGAVEGAVSFELPATPPKLKSPSRNKGPSRRPPTRKPVQEEHCS